MATNLFNQLAMCSNVCCVADTQINVWDADLKKKKTLRDNIKRRPMHQNISCCFKYDESIQKICIPYRFLTSKRVHTKYSTEDVLQSKCKRP
jgi:hypothetical protein